QLSGTIGCLVDVGDVLCILSNNHVLADQNLGRVGNTLIYQPGAADFVVLRDPDEASNDPGDVIGVLQDFLPLRRENAVDAALAKTSSGAGLDLVAPNFPDGTRLDPQPTDSAVGMPVHKFGRTTGHTFGRVIYMMREVQLSYEQLGLV